MGQTSVCAHWLHLQVLGWASPGVGTITLLAERQLAVAARASLACSSAKRWVTIAAKGNVSLVAPRNSSAALRWRGSLDQEPNTCSCLRVMTCGLNCTGPASQ